MESSPPPLPAAADNSDGSSKLHIVMLPWLAFGHMIPFLQLSKLIAQKGHKISFLSTPKNIDRLPKLPQPSLSPLINFVKLPLPTVANLPENAEATMDLPYEKVKYLKIAYDLLEKPVAKFLASSNPDFVFFDFAPYWLPQIASNLNIPTVYFNILNAAILAFAGPTSADYRTKPEDYTVPPKWIPFESTVAFRLFEILRIFNDVCVGDHENVSDMHRMALTIEGCDAIAVKSCSEFEPEWFQLLVDLHQKPVLPVGLLPASVDGARDSDGGVQETKSYSREEETMESDAGADQKLHIAMFPWLAFGHMIPFLQLSKLIAQKGHKISFLSTPKNIDRLPKTPQSLSPLINFVKLPLPHVQNLPENAEATIDLPYEQVKYLKIAYDRLQKPVTQFLKSANPDWVFIDFAPYWLPQIAHSLNISTAYFNILNAAFLGFLGPVPVLKGEEDYRTKPEDFVVSPKWVPFESTVAFRLFEILRIFRDGVSGDKENVSDTYRIGATIQGCDAVAVKSCSEFEPEWFELLGELHRKPVLAVGLLPAKADDGSSANGVAGGGWTEIEDWLEKQEKGSVVYIAFGSEAELSQVELTEIALGLELSELPFFWVLRNRGLNELPDGFVERVKGRGVVWTSWAPQPRLLSHDSVGGFLTHGGWGSIVDGIQFGRGLIVLPFLSDQGINARVLEEKKLGYSIPRDERDGSFDRDSVADSLRLVMVKEEGEVYRKKVKEMSGLFGDRDRQDRYVDNLLAFLQSRRRIRKEHEIA